MGTPQNPDPGDLHIDITDLQGVAVDITGDQAQALVKLHPGYEAALDNLLKQPAAMLARAGIDPGEITALAASKVVVDRTNAVRPAVDKLAETVSETGQVHKAKLASGLLDSASQVKRRAKRDPLGAQILAAFEPLLKHVAAAGEKATATKIEEGILKPKQPKNPKKAKPVATPPAATPPATGTPVAASATPVAASATPVAASPTPVAASATPTGKVTA